MIGPEGTLAVARLTCAHNLRQPLTWLVTAVGAVLIALSYFFGMFTWEDADRIRLLATAGVAATAINGLFLGVLLASRAIHDELASRTALTLFAKPMSRSAFLLGKIVGVAVAVAASMAVIAAVHVGFLCWARSQGFGPEAYDPELRWFSWPRLAGAHVLALAGNLVMVSLSSALALRLPLVANILVSFACFVAAHLAGDLTHLGGVILPPLHLYGIDDSLSFPEMSLTWTYFGLSIVAAFLYAGACVLLGMAFFAKQDIP